MKRLNSNEFCMSKTSLVEAEKAWEKPFLWLFGLLILTMVHFYSLFNNINNISGDISLYQRVIKLIFDGNMPYQDFDFEYPPYVILWFVLPGCFKSAQWFQFVFGLQILLIDVLVKAVLAWLAVRQSGKRSWMIPVLLFSWATAANYDLYLRRFDLIPAAISVIMLVAFVRKKYLIAGSLAAWGIGSKLYPILFVPPLLLLAHRQKQSKAFLLGLGLGTMPLLLLSFLMPWWRFLGFHAERGLQAESLYASLLWFLSSLGLVEAKWIWVRAWFEVDSPINPFLMPVAQALFIGAIFYAEVFVCWRAWRVQSWTLSSLARLILIPLTAFIAFNLVLSPQYLIWIVGLAAVAAMEGRLIGPYCFIMAAALIPLFYPSNNYGVHFNWLESTALLLRNVLLIVGLTSLVREWWPAAHICPSSPSLPST